jgi:hypothetical protein
MSPWLALVKKDFRLNRNIFFVLLGFLVLIGVLEIYIAFRYENGLMFGLSLGVFFLQIFLLPILVFNSLHKEWKLTTSHLWLNIPHSGFKLLTAKFVVGLVQTIVSMLIAFLFVLLMVHYDFKPSFGEKDASLALTIIQNYWWIAMLGTISLSALLGGAALFIYSMSKVIRRLGWLVGLVIVILGGWIWGLISETSFYKVITKWGAIQEPTINNPLSFSDNVNVSMGDGTPVLFIGEELFSIGVIFLMIWICSWLLDRRVEV